LLINTLNSNINTLWLLHKQQKFELIYIDYFAENEGREKERKHKEWMEEENISFSVTVHLKGLIRL